MHTTLAIVALAASASALTARAPAAGCSASYDGSFQIEILSAGAAKVKRQSSTCGQTGFLTASLSNGVLKDSLNRLGEVVANYQFQFDDIPQSDALYQSGFSVCNNGSLALGDSSVFYACQTSGGPGIGNYSNLYSQSIGGQCDPVLIDVIPCGSSSGAAGQSADGQVTVTGVVSQISDGQPQATATATGCVVSQIADGQLQMVTSCPTPTPTACVVSQIVDGQVQVTACPTTTAAPVSQISDGQIQATTTAAPVSQISDGQIQATTVAPVSQISDGQIQATSVAPVSQISDGQIQATTVATLASTTKSNATITSTSSPRPVTNSGNGKSIASTFAAVLVGAAAVLLL